MLQMTETFAPFFNPLAQGNLHNLFGYSPHWLYKKIKNLISGQLSGSEVNIPFQTVT